MDLLLAARRTGPAGHAIGVHMTDAMIERARKSAADAGMPQVEIRKGDATSLPVADDTLDVVISNGVLNLVPEKERGFAEIIRILKPGGRLHLADITLDVELPEDARRNIDLVDRLNRRCSAGGRARCILIADWPRGGPDHSAIWLLPHDIEGEDSP
jgi:arsenite methyltransferase